MKTGNFLSEFPPVPTEQWEQAIRETVSGPDYAARLIWHPEEGLAIKPYYRAEDLVGLPCLDAAPGTFPYVRGTTATADWRIRETIDHPDPAKANRAACEAVAAGAEEVAFSNVRLASSSDIALLLANLHEIPVHFEGLKKASVRVVANRLTNRPHLAGGAADVDPLRDPDFTEELIRCVSSGFRPFVIHADEYLESATGAIEEVGFAVSAGADFLDEMLERGLPLDRVAGSVGFEFASGPEFFIQIAKLRAFRMVWAKIVESFGGDAKSAKATVHSRTARWNKTIYDPHVNILRATTEVISSVMGGANSISVAAFDECYRSPAESSRRLARNTQLILKNEAMFARVADPVGGSYLIEALTDAIATKGWKLFQEIESAGGYCKARTAGVIGSVLEHCRAQRDKAVASRRIVLTGTSRFPDVADKALDRVDPLRAGSAGRAARAFEELRLRTERAEMKGRSPKILLAEVGDAKMRSARSQFTAEFLACAGFSSETRVCERAEQIAASDADVLVLCSSDQEYLAIAEELIPAMKERGNGAQVLVAGNPETLEQLRKLGVSDFIHVRSNAVDVLARLQEQIGIEV